VACELCRKPGGKMRLHKGKTYCHACLRKEGEKHRVRTPAIRGNFADFKPWFSWNTGEMVTSRAHERQLEREYATGSASDKGFHRDILGIEDGLMEEATETTLRRGQEALGDDRKLGEALGEKAQIAASKGERIFGNSEVRPIGDTPA